MNNPFPLHVKTIGIAAPASGADRSRYEASELKDKGIIERKGPDNGGEWKII